MTGLDGKKAANIVGNYQKQAGPGQGRQKAQALLPAPQMSCCLTPKDGGIVEEIGPEARFPPSGGSVSFPTQKTYVEKREPVERTRAGEPAGRFGAAEGIRPRGRPAPTQFREGVHSGKNRRILDIRDPRGPGLCSSGAWPRIPTSTGQLGAGPTMAELGGPGDTSGDIGGETRSPCDPF